MILATLQRSFCCIYLEVSLHASLVLLALGFVLVDSVNLVAQLGHAVVVLLAESSQGSHVGNVCLEIDKIIFFVCKQNFTSSKSTFSFDSSDSPVKTLD